MAQQQNLFDRKDTPSASQPGAAAQPLALPEDTAAPVKTAEQALLAARRALRAAEQALRNAPYTIHRQDPRLEQIRAAYERAKEAADLAEYQYRAALNNQASLDARRRERLTWQARRLQSPPPGSTFQSTATQMTERQLRAASANLRENGDPATAQSIDEHLALRTAHTPDFALDAPPAVQSLARDFDDPHRLQAHLNELPPEELAELEAAIAAASDKASLHLKQAISAARTWQAASVPRRGG